MASNATAAQKAYWDRLARSGCIITGGEAEIAHCHGGSIVERMQEPKAKGVKLQRYNWLVLPLAPKLHRTETYSLDGRDGVRAWEDRFGTQAGFIDILCIEFGLDLWALAKEGKK